MEFDFFVRNDWQYAPSVGVKTIYRHRTDESYNISHRRIDPEKLVLFYTFVGHGTIQADTLVFNCIPGSLVLCRAETALNYRCVGSQWDFWLVELKTNAAVIAVNTLHQLQNMPLDEVLLGNALSALKQGNAVLAGAVVNLLMCSMAQRLNTVYDPNNAALARSTGYIQENLQGFTVTAMADALDIPEKRLAQLFRQRYSMSPHQYFQMVRLEEAKTLLETTRQNIAGIVAELGYSSTGHFTKQFSRAYGVTPQKYRTRFRQQVLGFES